MSVVCHCCPWLIYADSRAVRSEQAASGSAKEVSLIGAHVQVFLTRSATPSWAYKLLVPAPYVVSPRPSSVPSPAVLHIPVHFQSSICLSSKHTSTIARIWTVPTISSPTPLAYRRANSLANNASPACQRRHAHAIRHYPCVVCAAAYGIVRTPNWFSDSPITRA